VARPTVWHSVAASALGDGSQKATISRAQRSTAMPGWAAAVAVTHHHRIHIMHLPPRSP